MGGTYVYFVIFESLTKSLTLRKKAVFFEKKCTKICIYRKKAVPLHPLLKKSAKWYMVNGQMVNVYGGLSSVGRASDCGSECRGFEPHIPPKSPNRGLFLWNRGTSHRDRGFLSRQGLERLIRCAYFSSPLFIMPQKGYNLCHHRGYYVRWSLPQRQEL